MHPIVELREAPTAEDIAEVFKPLVEYNESQAGPSGRKPFAFMVRDPATGETLGGLCGRLNYDWMFVEFLALSPAARGSGLGLRLMAEAEAYAARHGCVGLWLDTYEFQARPFYEKLGFSVCGVIENHPRGSRRYFMQKRLEATAAPQTGAEPQAMAAAEG